MLAKPSALPLGLVALLGLVISARECRSSRYLVTRLTTLAFVLAFTTGWWFVRNCILYGDPLGFNVYRDVFGAFRRSEPLDWSDLAEFVGTQFRSYWGMFGWMNLPAPAWFHWSMASLVAFAAGGTACAFARLRGSELSAAQRRALWILLTTVIFQESFTLLGVGSFNSAWYQGRYLFPVAAPIAMLLAFGLIRGFEIALPRRTGGAAIASVVLGLGVISSLAPFRWIAPAYVVRPVVHSRPLSHGSGRALVLAYVVPDRVGCPPFAKID
jgi:hypothetical protein